MYLCQLISGLRAPLWLRLPIRVSGPGAVEIWKARPVSAQVPLILSHMRQDLTALRPRTWDETVLAGGGRGEPGRCCFLSRGWSYGFPKTTLIYNPFSPPLHNFCLNGIHERTSGELCACSWSLSRHTAQAAASGFCWPTLTSTSALLAPWDLHGSICERSRATLPVATALTLGIQAHKYVSRWRVAWLHRKRTSLWWHSCSQSKGGRNSSELSQFCG